MMPGIVISSTSTVLISIHAVSAPLIVGLAAAAGAGAAVLGASLVCATTTACAAAGAGPALVWSPAGVCATAVAPCAQSTNASVAAPTTRSSVRITIPRLFAG